MQLAVRALIVLSLPLVAFGWLASALPEPPPAPSQSALVFAVGGIVLVLGGSLLMTGWEFVRTFRLGRPAPLPTPRPTALAGALAVIGTLSMAHLGYEGGDMLIVWLSAAAVTAVLFGLQLAVIVVVRALAGMWAQSELPMWPGRRTALAVLLAAALAATPVQFGEPDPYAYGFFVGGPPYLVPVAELVRLQTAGEPYPDFTYPDEW